MRIYHSNKLLTSFTGNELYASSVTYDTYAANAARPFRTLVWRTGTSSASEWLDLRFSAAKTATAFLIIDHNFVNGSDTLTLKANSSQSWGSPPFSQSLTVVNNAIIAKTFNSASYRYWRLEITKPSAGTQRQIGVVMLADYYDTPVQPDFDGYEEEVVDPSRISKSFGGQVYAEQLTKYRRITTDFSAADQTFTDSIKSIYAANGISGQLVVQVEDSGSLTELIYCRMTKNLTRKVMGVDTSLRYNMNLEFEEFV